MEGFHRRVQSPGHPAHRGRRGEQLKLICADGGKGLQAALPIVYPCVRLQLCWAHKTRNITDKVRRKDRDAVKRNVRQIYRARNLRAARQAAQRFAITWEMVYPAAVACLRVDLEHLLHFFQFKNEEWRKATRTTNAIERRFREVRRRTRPMGVFSDSTSIERILFAVFTHENFKQLTGAPWPLTQNS